jgi:hypothetical protein
MRKEIALATTAAFLLTLGCGPKNSGTRPPSGGEIVSKQHHTDHGFETDVVVTRGSDGVIVSQATAKDPTTGDTAEIWTDGKTIRWTGTIGGEPVSGSSPALDLVNPELPPTTVCLHPVAALLCVGAGLALLAGCAFGFSCEGGGEPPNTPEGGGGVPGGGEGEEEPEEEGD